jgi:hypothetical protein
MGTQDSLKRNRYAQLIEKIFFSHYNAGDIRVAFLRSELESTAKKLRIDLPKNLGDVIYSVRYRTGLPPTILATQPAGKEWIIEGTGRGEYAFRLVPLNRVVPNLQLVSAKLPDATPELVAAYALSDEQALLAKIRYNRLVDVFLGLASYSLQNHLRTSVAGVGQIEIDEIYVGVDKRGCQYVLPVQAKGGKDQLSSVQAKQDITCCAERFPRLTCRPLAAQFMADDLIAMFELALDGDVIKIVEERHYRLVPATEITDSDLKFYWTRPE